MDLRNYGIGAQILRDLDVGRMRLLARPRKMPSMAGFGLEVTGYEESAGAAAFAAAPTSAAIPPLSLTPSIMPVRRIATNTRASHMRVGIVAARFNPAWAKRCSRARCARSTSAGVPPDRDHRCVGSRRARGAAGTAAHGADRRLRRAGRARCGDSRRDLSFRDRRQRIGVRRRERAARVRNAYRQRHPDHRYRGAGGASVPKARDTTPRSPRSKWPICWMRSMKNSRSRSREFALQGFYQWVLSKNDPAAIRAQLADADGFRQVRRAVSSSDCGKASPASTTRCSPRSRRIATARSTSCRRSKEACWSSVRGSSARAGRTVPRRDQRGGGAGQVLRRHRRAQVRQRRARQARHRGAAAGSNRGARLAQTALKPFKPSPMTALHSVNSLTEFELIERFFRRPTRSTIVGVGDDAAVIAPTPGCELAVSVDMLVSGRHFFADADPEAHRAQDACGQPVGHGGDGCDAALDVAGGRAARRRSRVAVGIRTRLVRPRRRAWRGSRRRRHHARAADLVRNHTRRSAAGHGPACAAAPVPGTRSGSPGGSAMPRWRWHICISVSRWSLTRPPLASARCCGRSRA